MIVLRATQILGAVTSWCGATVAVLSILDWALSERQKTKLRGYLETVWIFLDYREPRVVERFLASTVGQFLVNAASLLAACWFSKLFMGAFVLDNAQPDALAILGIVYLVGTAMGGVWTFIYMRWLRSSSDLLEYQRRTSWAYAFVLALVGILFLSARLEQVIHDSLEPVFFILFFSLLFFCMAASIISSIVFYWRSAAWLFRGTLGSIKLVVERVVEYPKGPILGLGGLLMAIGSLVKILGS